MRKPTHAKNPPTFDDAFLQWLCQETEEAWVHHVPATLDQWKAWRAVGKDWQQGTRWLGGLSEEAIARGEQRWSLHFPPDYRRFLRLLHCVDRRLSDLGGGPDCGPDYQKVIARTPGHYRHSYEGICDGI